MEELKGLMNGPAIRTQHKRKNSGENKPDWPEMMLPLSKLKRSGESHAKFNDMVRSIRKRSHTRVMRSPGTHFSRIARSSWLNGPTIDQKIKSSIDLLHRVFKQGDDLSWAAKSSKLPHENNFIYRETGNEILPKQRRAGGDSKMVRMMRAGGGSGDMVRMMRAGGIPGKMARVTRDQARPGEMVRTTKAADRPEKLVRLMRSEGHPGDMVRMM